MIFLNEEALKSKDRNALSDKEFGIPELRKYPLNDKDHVISAIKMFNRLSDPRYEKELAHRIIGKMREYNISFDTIGTGNRLYQYVEQVKESNPIVSQIVRYNANKNGNMIDNDSIYLYHGSNVLVKELEPKGPDFGNLFEKPGFSTFCWMDKSKAELWCLKFPLYPIFKDMKFKWWCYMDVSQSNSFIMDDATYEFVYNRIKNKNILAGYIYTLKASINDVGVGNDSLEDEYTVRTNLTPINIEKVYLNTTTLDNHVIHYPTEKVKEWIDKKTKWTLFNRGLLSFIYIRDYRIQGVKNPHLEAKIWDDPDLYKYDSFDKFLKAKNIKLETLYPLKRMYMFIKGMLPKKKKFVTEQKYDPPYSYDDICDKYGKPLADKLMKDPAHNYRATTGIELIHKEPTREELDRIWKNWNYMDDSMKKKSDKKSIELFGMDNETHYNNLIKEQTILEGNNYDLSDIATFNRVLKDYRYGIYYKKAFIQDSKTIDKIVGNNEYKTLSPTEFQKYQGGVCWDYVAYQVWYFKKYFPGTKIKSYYNIAIDENGYTSVYTFNLFWYNRKVYWFEASLKSHAGIIEFNNETDALNYVCYQLRKAVDVEWEEQYIIEYNALDKRLIGVYCDEYMSYFSDKMNDSNKIDPKPTKGIKINTGVFGEQALNIAIDLRKELQGAAEDIISNIEYYT